MVSRFALNLVYAATLLAQSAELRELPIRDASARNETDGKPRFLGESVRIRGIAESNLIEAADGYYAGLLDHETRSAGLLIVFSGDNLDRLPTPRTIRAGMELEAEGVLHLHAGQVVLKPLEIRVISQGQAPAPIKVPAEEVATPENVGRNVLVHGEVIKYEENAAGSVLFLNRTGTPLQLIWPHPGRRGERQLAAFRNGDRVQAQGLLRLYQPSPQQAKIYQVLLGEPQDVEWLTSGGGMPNWLLPAAVAAVLAAMVMVWYQQQRMGRDQREASLLLSVSEELHSMPTVREAAELLRNQTIQLTGASSAHIYHYDAAKKMLDRIPDQSGSPGHSFHVEEGRTALERALGLAVQSGEVLRYRNTRGVVELGAEESDQALAALPMGKPGSIRGAFALCGPAGKDLIRGGILAPMQHLANDAGQHLWLLEQAARKEQNHRSEKLAVANQLIHGVINELNGPLERLRDLAAALPSKEAEGIQGQVKQVSEVVKRIVAVARAEQFDARPVDLRLLFQRLIEELQEVETEANLGPEQIFVLGSQDQLQRVFTNLLKHAQAAAAHSVERSLELSLNRIARNAMISISFSGPFSEGEGPDFHSAALGMAISRGLLQSYGGELRFTCVRPGRYRYDIELPAMGASNSEEVVEGNEPKRLRGTLTALLVDPEFQVQRQMLSLFGESGHRLVPVESIEEALDLCEKLRFDVLISSARPEGGTWAELFQRSHHRIPYFVLLAEVEDPSDRELLNGTTGVILKKPLEEQALEELLARISEKK